MRPNSQMRPSTVTSTGHGSQGPRARNLSRPGNPDSPLSSPSAYTSIRLSESVLMRKGGKHTLQSPKVPDPPRLTGRGGPGVARDGGASERRMGAVTPGETLGTLYNIHVGSNKTKQHKQHTASKASL